MPESNFPQLLSNLIAWLRNLLQEPDHPEPPMEPAGEDRQFPAPVRKKVSLVILDPIMDSEGGSRLTRVMGWNDPDRLATDFISNLRYASYGYANYEIVERILVDDFPPLEDGFVYNSADFMSCWRSRSGFHRPEWVDYHHLLNRLNLIEKINNGQIDEVWTMGFPYAGFYESRMGGPGAFWCNSPHLQNTAHVRRRFIVMAFNFERGVAEMLESYAHRVESIIETTYRSIPPNQNYWKRFIRHQKTHPGQAEVGTVHFAPNSRYDYDWGNPQQVLCNSHAWEEFPPVRFAPVLANCQMWGNGDPRAHHLWWLRHLPHVQGATSGILNNWWAYIVDPNLVR